MFKLASKYKPNGSQPEAIKKLTNGILSGKRDQVLLGVTGSGKTFTMANVIAQFTSFFAKLALVVFPLELVCLKDV